jgi:hypothetical protein
MLIMSRKETGFGRLAILGLLAALFPLAPDLRAQSEPDPPVPCLIIPVGNNSGSKKGNLHHITPFASVADIVAGMMVHQGGLPLPVIPDNTAYTEAVHGNATRVSPAFGQVPGMVRAGELDYEFPEVSTDSLAPAAIEAFDGESFEINAEQAPGKASLKDFFGVELSTGQVHVTLPTGLGFGEVGMHDTALSLRIGSSVHRVGDLGRFAAFEREDFPVVDLVVPAEEPCTGTGVMSFDMVQLLNSAPAIKRYRGGQVDVWQNAGPPSASAPTEPPIYGGFLSANLNSCEIQLGNGILTPPSQYLFGGANKPAIQWVNDAPVVNPPTTFAGEPHIFVAPPGVTRIMRWHCENNVVIMDETGRVFVYTPFFKARDFERCMYGNDLPHGTMGAPPQMGPLPQRMAEIQLVAKLIYEQTRDGLVTHYTYNAFRQWKGYRDPYGREIAFVYGSLESQDPVMPNLVTAAVDQFGRRTEFEYDAMGASPSLRKCPPGPVGSTAFTARS